MLIYKQVKQLCCTQPCTANSQAHHSYREHGWLHTGKGMLNASRMAEVEVWYDSGSKQRQTSNIPNHETFLLSHIFTLSCFSLDHGATSVASSLSSPISSACVGHKPEKQRRQYLAVWAEETLAHLSISRGLKKCV